MEETQGRPCGCITSGKGGVTLLLTTWLLSGLETALKIQEVLTYVGDPQILADSGCNQPPTPNPLHRNTLHSLCMWSHCREAPAGSLLPPHIDTRTPPWATQGPAASSAVLHAPPSKSFPVKQCDKNMQSHLEQKCLVCVFLFGLKREPGCAV